MEKITNFIEEISPMKETMTIRVRIIRLWKQPSYQNSKEDDSVEMGLMDEKVKKTLIKRFLSLLTECQLIDITNFGIAQNNSNLRTTQHPYKINFLFSTIVKDYKVDVPIALYGFNFVTFDDILSNRLDDKYLIDIIGQSKDIQSNPT
ncbi:Replication factor A protein 1 [Bienertia sinuspersici]